MKAKNGLRKASGCTMKAICCLVHGIRPQTRPNKGNSLHNEGNFMHKSRRSGEGVDEADRVG